MEVRIGNDLIVHEKILHSGSDVMAEKIQFSPPVIFPPGDDFLFGDQAVTYSRLQAGLAIGFRLGTFSGVAPGMFLQPDLKVLIEPAGVHISSFLFPFFGIFIPSDERIKTNVTAMDGMQALKNVMALQPKTYNYEDWWYEQLGEEGSQSDKPKRRGFIAQDVEKVLPNSVKKTKMALNGEMVDDFRDLRKEDLVVDAISAIQTLVYESIVDIAYLIDPSSVNGNGGNGNGNNNKRQLPIPEGAGIPPWAEAIRNCTQNTPVPSDRAFCICDLRGELCAVRPGAGICGEFHPLATKCIATFA